MRLASKFLKLWLLMLVLLLALSPLSAFANSKDSSSLNYVALGDSLAEGLLSDGETVDKGYPKYIAEKLNALGYSVHDNNYGEKGYTSTDVKDQLVVEQEIRKELQEADLVTVGVGANDLLGALGDVTAIDLGNQEELNAILMNVTQAITNSGVNLASILGDIKQLNPNAEIYVLGYYNAMPYLQPELQGKLVPLLEALNTAIKDTASKAGVTFVPTFDVFEGNYKEYLPNENNIHPNAAGYEAIADAFIDKIRSSFPDIREPEDSEDPDDKDQPGEQPEKPDLEGYELLVSPGWLVLEIGDTEPLDIQLVDPDGKETDVMKDVKYTLSDPEVVTIDQEGVVTAKKSGFTFIEIKYEKLKATVGIQVIRNISLDKSVQVNPGDFIFIEGTETMLMMPLDLPLGTTLKVTKAEDKAIAELAEAAGLTPAQDVLDFDFQFPEGQQDYTGGFLLMMGYDTDKYSSDEVDIYYYNESEKEWEKQQGNVDEAFGVIELETSHFSTYGVFAKAKPKGNKPPTNGSDNGDGSKGGVTPKNTTPPKSKGDKLPKTATNHYNWLLIGALLFAIGCTNLLVMRQKRLARSKI